MDIDLNRKIGVNEALLRQVNEAIERGLWPRGEDQVVRFRCECANLECNQAIELTIAEYEAVRANPRRFALVEGHERREAEQVVERRREHVVVEKVGESGVMAEEHDPRS